MRTHGQVFKMPQLAVPGNVRALINKFFDSSAESGFMIIIMCQVVCTQIKRIVTVSSGFKKKYSRKETIFIKNAHDLPKRRQFAWSCKERRTIGVNISCDFFV
jgi:hypothetical protein